MKASGLGTFTLMGAGVGLNPAMALANTSAGTSGNSTWKRYHHRNNLKDLTLSMSQMPPRDQLLQQALDRVPSAARIQQIHDVVMAHTVAEETGDLDATMATLVDNPIYEDVASGKTYRGHQDVLDDYRSKYKSFPSMKRHVAQMMIDKNGCFAELMWEGRQEGAVQGIKPPKNRPKIYLPVSVYWEVNDDGKIVRETVYYDQYLMLLNLDILPDIVNKPMALALLNPGLILRKK
jgi:steroid delta-isomerase-like uncharacterized protein